MFFGKKKKGGYVYVAESTRPDGSKKLYVGKTTRTHSTRWGEHMRSQQSENKKSWTSRGTYFRPIGAVWSNNPDKAERTVKGMSPEQKRNFGREGARRYKKKT